MIAHSSTTFGGPAAVAVGTNGQCRERRQGGGERPFGSSSRSCSCAPHQPRRSSTHPDHPSLVVTSSTSSSASDADPRRRTTVRARPPVHVSDSTSVLPGAHCSSISLLLDFLKGTVLGSLVSSRPVWREGLRVPNIMRTPVASHLKGGRGSYTFVNLIFSQRQDQNLMTQI
jgi:hypothetical protein